MSILSERRAIAPFGLQGGHPGSRGLNLLVRKEGVVNLGSKSSVHVEAGDRLRLLTPGAPPPPPPPTLLLFTSFPPDSPTFCPYFNQTLYTRRGEWSAIFHSVATPD